MFFLWQYPLSDLSFVRQICADYPILDSSSSHSDVASHWTFMFPKPESLGQSDGGLVTTVPTMCTTMVVGSRYEEMRCHMVPPGAWSDDIRWHILDRSVDFGASGWVIPGESLAAWGRTALRCSGSWQLQVMAVDGLPPVIQSSSICRWDFPGNQPSSTIYFILFGGYPHDYGEPPNLYPSPQVLPLFLPFLNSGVFMGHALTSATVPLVIIFNGGFHQWGIPKMDQNGCFIKSH